ncbi:hypothetical protein PABG_00622 [Paracoccidioides brasiliensis Pb03]|nr:hypothetical protein PABG_00622 [Paracoccidioides brasiliensis Pb03]
MSASSSLRADSPSTNASPSSHQQVREASQSDSELHGLEYEEKLIVQQIIPQPDASDDGISLTEYDSISDSDSNRSAHKKNEQAVSKKDYDSSEGSPETERPNNYRGPPSTWRAKTRQERQEISALEALRARDLSIHLFNAFALKRRAKKIESFNSEQVQEHQSSNSGNAGPASSFVPTKQWTAWPLPADEVPRGDEHVQKDVSDICNMTGPSDGRPSTELEECIMAQMLKTAKEKFEARVWKDRQPHLRHRSNGAPSDTAGTEMNTENDSCDGEIGVHAEVQFRPVVLADDEKSRVALRPSARHILNDLDNILLCLHHSRQSYVTTVDLSQSECETEPEDGSNSRPTSRSRARSRRSRSRSRGIDRSWRLSANTVPTVMSDREKNVDLSDAPNMLSHPSKTQRPRSNTPRRSRSRSPGSRQSKLGLRDWSDIVGIASMTGWPTSVVMRTAKRCSELFGEDMAFRTLNEVKLVLSEGAEKSMPTWEYTDKEGSGEFTDFEIPNTTNIVRRRGLDLEGQLLCPVKGCSRSTKGFSRTWNLNQHVKNRHPNLKYGSRQNISAPQTEDPD